MLAFELMQWVHITVFAKSVSLANKSLCNVHGRS